jgi:hypothetical protein
MAGGEKTQIGGGPGSGGPKGGPSGLSTNGG